MINLPWILLIVENTLLIIALTIYLTRKCTKCQQVKCIERIFNSLCRHCKKGHSKNPQLEVF